MERKHANRRIANGSGAERPTGLLRERTAWAAAAFFVVVLVPLQLRVALAQTPSDPTAFRLPPEAVEHVTKRTQQTKVFQLPSGRFVATSEGPPLHYQDAQGRWQDIDLHLRPAGNDFVSDRTRHRQCRLHHDHGGRRQRHPLAAARGRRDHCQ